MKNKILSVIITIGLVASLLGCGSNEQDKNVVGTDVESSVTETVESEPDVTAKAEEKVAASEDKAEVSYNADDFEEQKDIFVVKHIDTGDGTEIDFTNQEVINGPFTLGDSIDIYSFYFTYAGYTKPNIKIEDVWKVDEWIVVPFAQSSFLVKAEDFDRVAVLKEKANSTTEDNIDTESEPALVEQNTASQKDSGSSEAVSATEATTQENAPAPAPAPEPVTTYSEAEVISIFRSTLESNGIQWYPNVYPNSEAGPSGGMGWGIEDISMTDPYGDAAKSVEGFQFAGWNLYYLESQGSSDGYVHLKLYSGTN